MQKVGESSQNLKDKLIISDDFENFMIKGQNVYQKELNSLKLDGESLT